MPPGIARAFTAITLIVRFGAVPGQTPACTVLPVGKSVGFDVTTVLDVLPPPPASGADSVVEVESAADVVELSVGDVVVLAVVTEPSAL